MPDIYTRTDDMLNYQPDLLEVDDDISLLILQLENLLFTEFTAKTYGLGYF